MTYNYRKHFKPELVANLLRQVTACIKPDKLGESDDIDVFYSPGTQNFDVFLSKKHGWTSLDADFVLWSVPCKGTSEEVVDKILEEFVDSFDIPRGGYHCRPITWGPPPLETLVVHDIQLLLPREQQWLRESFDERTVKVEVKSFTERTEYWISFPPAQKEDILATLNRYVKS